LAVLSVVRQQLTLLGREFSVQNQIRHAQDAIHGCPDLVTHIGEKKALGAAGGFGLCFCFLKGFFSAMTKPPLGQRGGGFLGQRT
jgi:hypothetical protein